MKKYLLLVIIMLSLSFAQDAKISALGFYDVTYTTDVDISNEFEFNRMYFTFVKKMTDVLSYKFQTDVGRKSDDGRLEVYLKNAKIDWKTEYGKFVIGLQGMNVFNVQEKTWGYRSIEKSAMDKYKFASSADMGLGYYHKIGAISYNMLVTNGTGYKKSEDDSYKKLSVQVYYGPGKLNSKNGLNAGTVVAYEPYSSDGGTEAEIIVGVFGGYSFGPFRAGAEFDQLQDSEEDVQIRIVSGYGNYALNDKVSLFGRLDYVDYGDDSKNYIITGIAVAPEKGLKIMPNIRYTKQNDTDAEIEYKLNFEFNIK